MATVRSSPGGLDKLSALTGTPEPALRLLCSILFGFPLALIHRYTLYGKGLFVQHVFFTASGLFLGYWNYGWNTVHSAVTLLVTYLILRICGGTRMSVFITFVFNMTYLLVGYYTTSTEDYDIKWTMPQCVLTLRLIGLAFDVLDGKKEDEALSEKQRETALKVVPSLLEMAAFSFFPGSCLVGPQFSMRRYLDYVNGQLVESDSNVGNKLLDCLTASLQRACIGLFYVIVFQIGSLYISDQYLLSREFEKLHFLKRCFVLGFWGRITMYKYIVCWLLAEGVCIAFGLTYNGQDKQGRPKWDGCANVKLQIFENATQFNHYILSFNINTNHWCAEYIYKRLKFLKSKIYSQVLTLLFIAVWHGLHSGYYLCFFMEFIVMYFEKDIGPVLEKNEKLQNLLKTNLFFAATIWILSKIYTFVFMGYALVPFVFLSYQKYMQIFANFYYMGHVFFLSYPLFAPFIKSLLRESTPRSHAE